MEYVKLNNGVEMPMLGFGVFQIDDLNICEQAVTDAIHAGYRLFDTAALYQNEEAVGRAIKKSGLPREDFFITTKLWPQDTGYENTKKAFQTSLDKLGTDYLDLYLLHQNCGDVYGSWRAMEELYEAGKIRAIGISNFRPERVVDFVLHNKTMPALIQLEYHPRSLQVEMRKVLAEYGIALEAFSPLDHGLHSLTSDPVLVEIGKKYGKTAAQVVLRWDIQNGVITIPKSTHRERIEENFNVFDFALTAEEMDKVTAIGAGEQTPIDITSVDFIKFISTKKIHD